MAARPPPTADEIDTESINYPRANKKTELTPRVITRFERYPRESKQTEMKLRATNLFKRPPMILGGPSGDGPKMIH